jgi:hypothetical protein
MSAEGRPTDDKRLHNDPLGNNLHFDDDPSVPDDDSDKSQHRSFLFEQKAGFETYTHPGERSRRMFEFDQPVIDYHPEVVARRPDWIACPDLSSNRATVQFLFPGWRGPTGEIDHTYHGTTAYNIAATLFDVEGHILGKYQLEAFHILNLLRLTLCANEEEVFIHPTPVTDMLSAPHELLHGDLPRQARGCRWWVFLCHRFGGHWTLAIHDQAAEITFHFDSSKESSRQDQEQFLQDRIRPILETTLEYADESTWSPIAVNTTSQAGQWECGLWVVEYARIFFQEFWGRLLAGHSEIKLSMTRCYWGDNLTTAKKRMLYLWLEFCRTMLGQRADTPLRRHGIPRDDPYDAACFRAPTPQTSRPQEPSRSNRATQSPPALPSPRTPGSQRAREPSVQTETSATTLVRRLNTMQLEQVRHELFHGPFNMPTQAYSSAPSEHGSPPRQERRSVPPEDSSAVYFKIGIPQSKSGPAVTSSRLSIVHENLPRSQTSGALQTDAQDVDTRQRGLTPATTIHQRTPSLESSEMATPPRPMFDHRESPDTHISPLRPEGWRGWEIESREWERYERRRRRREEDAALANPRREAGHGTRRSRRLARGEEDYDE